jgi:molybdopterin-containing oxidoreductase family iron-sulfur binding subunit
MSEMIPNNDRRNFLRNSLGTVAVSVLGGSLMNSFASCKSKPQQAAGKKVKVLSHDGQLMEIDKSQLATIKPHISNEDVRKGIPGKKFVMVIDLAKCDGCGKCTKACNSMHYLPSNKEWIEVLEMQDAPETAAYYFPKPCYHCDNPPCIKVCLLYAICKDGEPGKWQSSQISLFISLLAV